MSKGFFERKKIIISPKAYFIDAMSAMAYGLFASLLIGTIFGTIGSEFDIEFFTELSTYAKSVTGGVIGVAIAFSLNAPMLVVLSVATVGLAGNTIGGIACAYIACLVATEVGKILAGETKVDIILTPTITMVSGLLVCQFIGPYVSALMTGLGNVIMNATTMQPLLMGILVAVIVGLVLTFPISSAALCIMLDLNGLAGGAATAGCCAHMIGFAVASFRDNGVGGLIAQGLGTSMLQVPNIFKKPTILLTPILTSAVTGPLATVVFKMTNISTGAGMGTSGLVGPIGVITSMGANSETFIAILCICFVFPACLAVLFDTIFRKMGIIKKGDMKI